MFDDIRFQIKKATCFFRTSHTPGMSPFFNIPVQKYFNFVFQFFFTLCIIRTPAAAVQLRPKFSAVDRGTV